MKGYWGLGMVITTLTLLRPSRRDVVEEASLSGRLQPVSCRLQPVWWALESSSFDDLIQCGGCCRVAFVAMSNSAVPKSGLLHSFDLHFDAAPYDDHIGICANKINGRLRATHSKF